MKKTLMTASVAVALGLSMGVQAAATDDDTLTTPAAIGTTAEGGAKTVGAASKATNKAKGSYNSTLDQAANSNISSGFNDINSHNTVDIKEDGIVSYAQDLNQAVASSDLNHVIGSRLGTTSATAGTSALGGNMLVDNSATGTAGLGGNLNSVASYENFQANAISAGSFNNFGGVSSTSQDLGNMAEIGQSAVIQSNGNI